MSLHQPATRATGYRRDLLWLAAMVHRISGILLALFLPVHFLVLGLAIESEAHLDRLLAWTANPWVKAAEMCLVFLLGVHLLGGLRVLAVEFLRYRNGQKRWAAIILSAAAALALLFFIRAA
jgi:fumarate reductase subunit D